MPVVDGLSAGAVREITRWERSQLSPGAVARALAQWSRTVHGRVSALVQEPADYGCPCCDPLEPRAVLELALTSLGRLSRRELGAKVQPLDDLFESRTIPDPYPMPDLDWWRRRG